MKRLFVFFFCILLLPFIHAHAAEYTYTDSKVTSIKITTQRTTADVTVTYTGDISKSGSQGDVIVWKEKAANGSYGGKIFDEFLQFNKTKPTTATYKITGLEPKKTYYLSYMSAGHAFTTEATGTCTPDPNPADGIEKLGISYDGSVVILSGKFDPTKHPCFLNFNLSIEVSKDSFDDTTKQPGKIAFAKPVQDLEKSAEGIGLDGRYFFRLANLDPETIYYFKQTVTDTTSGGLTKTTTGNFPSTKGTILVGSTQQSFEEHSYRLLAPFPGFTVLMDPELCAVQKAQHKIAPDAVCDVNDLLNFAFRLLIGVAAALLIFRLMLAGYQYITTDVPFLKNNAKTHITQSALGILLALSAFLILNTINPKLVNNRFKLNAVQVGIEVINLPDAGDDSVDPDFSKNNFTYSKDASISPEVTNVVNKIKNEGWTIDSFKIYTNDRMLIYLKKGTQTDNTNIINVGHGLKGFSQQGQGTTGDKKTPIGNWKILEVRKSANPGQPVYNAQGANMGAAFFLLSPTTNGERGIGMHGNKTGTITGTNGCIRLKNADIEALLPYIKVGTPVVIGN